MSGERQPGPQAGRATAPGAPRAGRRSATRWLALAGTLVGLTALGLWGAGAPSLRRPAGEPAPDVTVRTESGAYRLSEQRGKVVVLYFSFPG
ncbi:MAG TPA: hypothetical protein VNM66_00870 [Thermodesulfobacteriota bacterium]|nr:hypothetical protein [Thermodesulfobacteriota bacterium]